ncbi:MAG TPA: hypothetical protein VKI65_18200 [Gemmataceae bacterium]|nr:hypothetical protein [Gemmataceae bacterium]
MFAVKAHFDGKVIVPDESVDLPKNQPLLLRIELAKVAEGAEEQSALEWIAENAVADDPYPPDYSYQLDHYLYGTPKKPPPGP